MDTPPSEVLIFDQKLIEERNYWIAKLTGKTGSSSLHLDFPRSQEYLAEKDTIPITLTKTTCQRLFTLANDGPFLIYTILMTALMICLCRYTGNNICIIGSPSRKQDNGVDQPVNALAILDQIDQRSSFRHHLLAVRQTLLDAYVRQHYPFQRLIWDLHIESEEQKCSLFDIALELTNIHAPLPEVKNDITITFTINTDSLHGYVAYNCSLYRKKTVERFTECFVRLLSAGLENINAPIAKLEMLKESERYQQLVEWNHNLAHYPQDSSLHQLFEAQTEKRPDSIALAAEDQYLTFQELNHRANQLAYYLRRLGVGPDVPVGLYLERSLEMIIGVLAVFKAGGAYVPLDLEFPQDRVADILTNLQARLVLTQHKLQEKIPESSIRKVFLDTDWKTIDRETRADPDNYVKPDNLAYVIYTSGSTGSPKGVSITHRNLINYSSFICQKLKLKDAWKEEGRGLHFAISSTISTDLANTAIFPSLISGGCLHILSYSLIMDGDKCGKYMLEHSIDVLKIVPSHLSALMTCQAAGNLLPRKYLILGGEAFSFGLLRHISSLSAQCQIINHYGPTETTVGSLTFNIEQPDQYPWASTTVPIGRPIANVQTYVLDSYLNPVPIGIPGELYIGGIGGARGYHGLPEQTAERFIPDPFFPGGRLYKTGDLVRYLEDGNIEFLDRIDQQIKIRGFRVELKEIETALRQHPSVQECVILARADPFSNKHIVAYVLSRKKQFTIDDLRNFLKSKLPEYMIPSGLVVLDAFPLTLTGKVDRQKLQSMQGLHLKSNAIYVAPRSELERTITIIWQEVLGVEQVGIHDNFFDLGGHSLLMVRVHSKLKETIGQELSMVDLFKYPTIEHIAEYLSCEHAHDKSLEWISDHARKQKVAVNRQRQLIRGRLKSHE